MVDHSLNKDIESYFDFGVGLKRYLSTRRGPLGSLRALDTVITGYQVDGVVVGVTRGTFPPSSLGSEERTRLQDGTHRNESINTVS